ncbi:lysostaphin resistance A-like protein [Capnocytophaga canimorsus]|uniref:CPBP family intramembrane glutamic endopeptidase n=1 Tax=Capnocytophaga canimorsus TaxID=28188 RepID=UPI00385C51E6
MYIENAYFGKSPKWLYIIPPLLFFGMSFLGAIAIFLIDIDTETIMKAEIARKGELPFLFENLLIFVFLFLGMLFWIRFVSQQPLLKATTSRSKTDWKRIFFAFALWGGITSVLVLADYLFFNPQNYIWNFQPIPFLWLTLMVIIMIPMQTSFEEYFFRGFLMQGLGIAVKNKWFPLIFTSVTFGLAHIANPEISKLGYGLLAYYIGTGLFLGIITLMDEGLELALGFHAANNLFTALLVTSDWTAFQTPSLLRDVAQPSLWANIFLPLLVFFPILLIIFAKKYHWHSWKQKLTGKVLSENEFLNKQNNNTISENERNRFQFRT